MEESTFDLTVEVFYPFYFYCLAYEITVTWPKCTLVCLIDAKTMLNVATFLKTAVTVEQSTSCDAISQTDHNNQIKLIAERKAIPSSAVSQLKP